MFSLSSLQTRDDQDVITNMAEIEQWNQKDVTARNYIFATLAKPMKENLYSCQSAAAMWTKLDTQYKLKAAENLHLLWQSFYDFNYHPGNLKIYIYIYQTSPQGRRLVNSIPVIGVPVGGSKIELSCKRYST